MCAAGQLTVTPGVKHLHQKGLLPGLQETLTHTAHQPGASQLRLFGRAGADRAASLAGVCSPAENGQCRSPALSATGDGTGTSARRPAYGGVDEHLKRFLKEDRVRPWPRLCIRCSIAYGHVRTHAAAPCSRLWLYHRHRGEQTLNGVTGQCRGQERCLPKACLSVLGLEE